MKLFLLATPLLAASITFARSPLKRGQTTDTCANLDVDLVIADGDGNPHNAGHIDLGLCISQVNTVVDHYSVTEAAAKVVGVDKVVAAIIDLIKKGGVECSYPLHAKPSVTKRNECDFVCVDGFLAMPADRPSTCMCPTHLKECNGQCDHFHLDCSTTPPPSRRENDPKCAEHLTLCGVPDATSGKAYKCTDVMSDSFTCGACVKESPFGSPSTGGVNCHAISNVDDVSCMNGKCLIHTCKSGFAVSASGSACTASATGKSMRGLPMPGNANILSAVGAPLSLVEGEMEMISPNAIVNKVGASH